MFLIYCLSALPLIFTEFNRIVESGIFIGFDSCALIRNGSHGDRNISLCVSYNLVFEHFHRFSQKSIESLILKLCIFSRDPSYREGFTFVYDVLHCIPSFFKCSRDLHKFMEINGKTWNPVEILYMEINRN